MKMMDFNWLMPVEDWKLTVPVCIGISINKKGPKRTFQSTDQFSPIILSLELRQFRFLNSASLNAKIKSPITR